MAGGSSLAERLDLTKEVWQPAAGWQPLEGSLDLWKVPLKSQLEDWELLAMDERIRADRRVIVAKREQLVSGRAALRRILARYQNLDPKELRFDYGKHGRPSLLLPLELDSDPASAAFDFNLSHSEDMALVGVSSSGRIGVDVEWRRLGRPFDRMAARFFSAPEFEDYNSLREVERIQAFYQTWCRKEAYLKAWGTGLSFSSRKFSVAITKPLDPWLRSSEMPGDKTRAWNIADLSLGAQYPGAACFEGRPDTIRLFEL